jgi:cytoskeletal protein CcmA (bactofilin family)
MNRFTLISLLLGSLLSLPSAVAAGQKPQAGETVLVNTPVDGDLYAAGGQVDVLAEVDGDVVVAGGDVTIDTTVTQDVIAAGGSVTVHGRVGDDVRLAGGEVMINADIGDAAVAAGGNVTLAPAAKVGGDLMFGGGRLELAGQVRGDARLAGGEIEIDGQVDGDVEVTAEKVKIGPHASIRGALSYRSPEPAEIDPQANIAGEVTHLQLPVHERRGAGGVVLAGLFMWLTLGVTGIVLFLLLPRQALAVGTAISTEPWKTLGLGLAMFTATPLVALLLLTTGLGALLAWLLIMVYGLLLLTGYLNGVLFLDRLVLRRLRKGDEPSKTALSLTFLPMLLVVMIVGLVPVLGFLLVLLLLLFGIGGITLQAYRARQAGMA